VAGTGSSGYNGDGIQATAARLNYPKGVEVGPDGALYIGDANNHRVRRVDLSTGVITTVAGTGTAGSTGDGGPATSARLNTPRNVTFGPDGDMYIADDQNYKVRRVDAVTKTITTVAGTGTPGYSGDGGAATSARLNQVRDVAVDGAGNLYIADEINHRIRWVDTSGTMRTFAGTGVSGFSGDGGPATSAQIRGPRGVAVDPQGRVLIGDTGNHVIRRVG
jgi:streptogramin lyase